jgi:dephospho-CoA kinase
VDAYGEAVLLTGVYGSGKSTVAAELADLLERAGSPYALLDLDFLSWFGTGGEGHGAAPALLIANLAAVAANYRRAGIRRFVLAYAVQDASELSQIRAALGWPVRVVRLSASPGVVRQRLGADPTAGRQDDLRQALIWLEQSRGVGLEDITVDGDRDVHEIAAQIMDWLGWR